MTRLLPLADIPHGSRAAERVARGEYPTRAAALGAAQYEVIEAPGTYGTPFPSTLGWVLTGAAAQAIAAEVIHMPGGTCHHGWTYRTAA